MGWGEEEFTAERAEGTENCGQDVGVEILRRKERSSG